MRTAIAYWVIPNNNYGETEWTPSVEEQSKVFNGDTLTRYGYNQLKEYIKTDIRHHHVVTNVLVISE